MLKAANKHTASMIRILFAFLLVPAPAFCSPPEIPSSQSPNGKINAVLDIDRDPTIDPEWKGDSYPKIEITEIETGKILLSVNYFGEPHSDTRPLREHVELKWRNDSNAFAITIHDRHYSYTEVYARGRDSDSVKVSYPSYEEMTGYPPPNSNQLRPRGRSTTEGWDKKGRLIYDLFSSPLPSYSGKDPLHHRVALEVTPTKMVVIESHPLDNQD